MRARVPSIIKFSLVCLIGCVALMSYVWIRDPYKDKQSVNINTRYKELVFMQLSSRVFGGKWTRKVDFGHTGKGLNATEVLLDLTNFCEKELFQKGDLSSGVYMHRLGDVNIPRLVTLNGRPIGQVRSKEKNITLRSNLYADEYINKEVVVIHLKDGGWNPEEM